MPKSPLIPSLVLIAVAAAHTMGNFSVSHYTRLEAQPSALAVTYILDLAELPTFELLQKWDLKQDSPKAELDAKATAEAREWARNLKFTLDGKPVSARLLDTQLVMANGAGNLPIARVVSHLTIAAPNGGTLDYEDTNYAERAGWKEISVASAKGTSLVESSQINFERSKALTEYPADPTVAPPQELRAHVQWKSAAVVRVQPKAVAVEQPKAVEVLSTNSTPVGGPPAVKAPGEVVKGDALSNLLSRKDLTVVTVLVALALAFWFGALHATTPGHGKTMVAAYLVGERGTAKHALLLGAIVTVTHTMSVFAMGIAAYFLAGSFAADKVTYVLQVVSGLMIVVVGLWLLYKRSMKLMNAGKPAEPHVHHPHDHDHEFRPAEVAVAAGSGPAPLKLVHSHERGRVHHDHSHDHGPGGHSHVPEGPVTMGSLLALGASGGLVPCPSALILLLSAISIGRIGFGLALLVSFSLGLAIVLMAIGLAVLYAKQMMPKTSRTINHPIVKLMPVISAVFVTCIGLLMTAYAVGWIKLGV